MKNFFLFCCFVLLTAFTCENEPLEGEFGVNTSVSCEIATQNLLTAAENFSSAIPTDSNYTQLCLAYKIALQDQIIVCGDDGTLQAVFDNLGDCGDDPQPDECDNATTAANQAESAFNNADDTNYSDLCNAYKSALQDKINACGDTEGNIQSIIDGLGDCTPSTPSVEISLTAGTLPIEFNLVTVTVNGNILEVNGESSISTYSIYFEVEQDATGTDIINSTFQLTLTSTFYPSTEPAPFNFVTNITTNYADVLVGTFGGVVTNTDGGDLSITSGVIDITY